MSTLVVFVHGLGADEREFWGSTPDALRSHQKLSPDISVKFWGYPTTRKPRPIRRFLRPLGIGRRLQTVDSLGEHLWSNLRLWFKEGQFDEIKLLGHSMGGLVVASALGQGYAKQRADDAGLIESVAGVAFVATPLGGAKLADKAGPLFAIFGKNVQVADLAQDSSSRKVLVSRFIGQVLAAKRVPLTIFRAADDTVVLREELTSPLGGAGNLDYKQEVLAGAHSECVQDLEWKDDNLKKLINWANGPHPPVFERPTRSALVVSPLTDSSRVRALDGHPILELDSQRVFGGGVRLKISLSHNGIGNHTISVHSLVLNVKYTSASESDDTLPDYSLDADALHAAGVRKPNEFLTVLDGDSPPATTWKLPKQGDSIVASIVAAEGHDLLSVPGGMHFVLEPEGGQQIEELAGVVRCSAPGRYRFSLTFHYSAGGYDDQVRTSELDILCRP